MSIGVLLVTHPGVGEIMLTTASEIIGACPLRTVCLGIAHDADTLGQQQCVHDAIEALDNGHGVLVLTDAFGATPSNIACTVALKLNAIVVSGINLPMLIRVFNYADMSLEALADKAAEGAVRGIQISAKEPSA